MYSKVLLHIYSQRILASLCCQCTQTFDNYGSKNSPSLEKLFRTAYVNLGKVKMVLIDFLGPKQITISWKSYSRFPRINNDKNPTHFNCYNGRSSLWSIYTTKNWDKCFSQKQWLPAKFLPHLDV